MQQSSWLANLRAIFQLIPLGYVAISSASLPDMGEHVGGEQMGSGYKSQCTALLPMVKRHRDIAARSSVDVQLFDAEALRVV